MRTHRIRRDEVFNPTINKICRVRALSKNPSWDQSRRVGAFFDIYLISDGGGIYHIERAFEGRVLKTVFEDTPTNLLGLFVG